MNIFVDANLNDPAVRQALYSGSLVVYSPSPSALKLCALAKDLLEEAFHPHDIEHLPEVLPREKVAEILGVVKPQFIHHPKSKEYLQGLLAERGFDMDKTYFDVPRLRTGYPGDFLKSGIAYAFHPHRDTWYSAPQCQINWWMPVNAINADNCMAVHPNYWDQGVKNGSGGYNYARWNEESRQTASQHVAVDTRVQPKPEEDMILEPDVRLVCDVGGAYLFSAAQMHSSVTNTSGATRYSIDFRMINIDDAWEGKGAPNVNSSCTGTSLGDFLRASDFAKVPDELVARYDR